MNLTFVDEIVEPQDIDLQSFEGKNILCPEIWKTEDSIYPKVRNALLLIAKDFRKDVGIDDIEPADIIITGSLANYNWDKTFSDIDLHILIDSKKLSAKKDFAEKYLKAVRTQWNDRHDIKICSFPVEVYIQDIHEPHNSTGIYSLTKNEWLKKPSTSNFNYNKIDKNDIRTKAAEYATIIEDIEDRYRNATTVEELKAIYKDAKRLFNKIKGTRSNGEIIKGFELSTNNIVFKYLRRYGQMQSLYKIITLTYDEIHSYDHETEKDQISV